MPVLLRVPGVKLRGYRPLTDETGLFLTFAALDPTTEAILAFANEYGPLGGEATYNVHPITGDVAEMTLLYPGADPPIGRNLLASELLPVWMSEIVWMQHLVGLWQMALKKDRKGLAAFISWEGSAIHHRCPVRPPLWSGAEPIPDDVRDVGQQVWSDYHAPDGAELFPRGDLAGPALLFVMRAINSALSGGVSPKLFWSVAGRRRR